MGNLIIKMELLRNKEANLKQLLESSPELRNINKHLISVLKWDIKRLRTEIAFNL